MNLNKYIEFPKYCDFFFKYYLFIDGFIFFFFSVSRSLPLLSFSTTVFRNNKRNDLIDRMAINIRKYLIKVDVVQTYITTFMMCEERILLNNDYCL